MSPPGHDHHLLISTRREQTYSIEQKCFQLQALKKKMKKKKVLMVCIGSQEPDNSKHEQQERISHGQQGCG
jgi:hypothetical protein